MSLSQALPEASPGIGLLCTICSSVSLAEKYPHQISTSWKQSRSPTPVCLPFIAEVALKSRVQTFRPSFYPALLCGSWGMCGVYRNSSLLRPVTLKLLSQTPGETLPQWLSGCIQRSLIETCLPITPHCYQPAYTNYQMQNSSYKYTEIIILCWMIIRGKNHS